MNVLAARVALRERPLVDVLDLALRFVAVHGAAYARVAAFVLVPGILLATAAASALGWIAGWAIAIATRSLVQLPFTVLASRLVFEEGVRARDVVRATWSALGPVLLVRVVTLVALVCGLAAVVLPALWALAALFFVDEVLLLERASPSGALGRAQRLGSASLGAAMLAVIVLISAQASAVLLADAGGRALLGEVLQLRPPPSLFAAGGSVLGVIGLFLATPFVATARFFVYLDVRTRAEGWDVQTRFAALAAREARETEAR